MNRNEYPVKYIYFIGYQNIEYLYGVKCQHKSNYKTAIRTKQNEPQLPHKAYI